jgi:endonuclease/exonuclease/phosphatase family metal-dependent hydrolase
LRAIIEILSRFDVIAIQEVKGDLRALRDTLHFLGEGWAFLMTDVNAGGEGNDERLAFLFDLGRLKPSGLAAELVVPQDRLNRIDENALKTQFSRTPYAVSFVRGKTTFILVTLHILFGKTKKEKERLPELLEIAGWMKDWAKRSNRFHHNLLALGDFNIDRKSSSGFQAFTSTGLTVPDVLMDLPRTIFDKSGTPSDDNFFDQIAWFTSGQEALIDMTVRNGGNFDFVPHVYRELNFTPRKISDRVSDHLPLWIEFGI